MESVLIKEQKSSKTVLYTWPCVVENVTGVEWKSVHQENVSRGHIFLGNPVLPNRIFCLPQDQVSSLQFVFYHVILFDTWHLDVLLHVVDDSIYDDTNDASSLHWLIAELKRCHMCLL